MKPLSPPLRREAVEAFIKEEKEETNGINFRFAGTKDAKFILSLRLEPTRNQHVSSVSNDIKAQEEWLNKYKDREQDGFEFYFIIELANQPIGTIRIYDIKDNSFCWGSWMIAPGAPPRASLLSAYMVYQIGFDALGFEQSHFDVRKKNQSVNRFHRKMGAEQVEEDSNNYYYRIQRPAVYSYFLKRLR